MFVEVVFAVGMALAYGCLYCMMVLTYDYWYRMTVRTVRLPLPYD